MEYWEDRNCSKAYLKLLEWEDEAFVMYRIETSDDLLEQYQERMRQIKEEIDKLGPEDFGLAEGDYFVNLTYNVRHLYKIEDGVLKQHSTNDVWYKTRTETLQHAMGMTMKGKWMRFREAPLGK